MAFKHQNRVRNAARVAAVAYLQNRRPHATPQVRPSPPRHTPPTRRRRDADTARLTPRRHRTRRGHGSAHASPRHYGNANRFSTHIFASRLRGTRRAHSDFTYAPALPATRRRRDADTARLTPRRHRTRRGHGSAHASPQHYGNANRFSGHIFASRLRGMRRAHSDFTYAPALPAAASPVKISRTRTYTHAHKEATRKVLNTPPSPPPPYHPQFLHISELFHTFVP